MSIFDQFNTKPKSYFRKCASTRPGWNRKTLELERMVAAGRATGRFKWMDICLPSFLKLFILLQLFDFAVISCFGGSVLPKKWESLRNCSTIYSTLAWFIFQRPELIGLKIWSDWLSMRMTVYPGAVFRVMWRDKWDQHIVWTLDGRRGMSLTKKKVLK